MSDPAARIRERWQAARGPLFTDLYELAMAQVYWREGIAEQAAQFDHFFRRYPNYGTHQAGYCVTAGLGLALFVSERSADWAVPPPVWQFFAIESR